MPRAALLLTIGLIGAAPALAGPVRFFAVGNELRLEDAVTYQTFRDRMAALMDASFPGRGTLVQAGVDDGATHLAPLDPPAPAHAPGVFPPDPGLLASFIGT